MSSKYSVWIGGAIIAPKAPAHRCVVCQHDHLDFVSACHRCGSTRLVSVTPEQYCEKYGHAFEEIAVPASKRIVPGTMGRLFTMIYRLTCSRCGVKTTEQREGRNNV